MKLLFDTSVWIEHLRYDALEPLIEPMRGRFTLGLDAIVASELRAGCRSKRERRVIDRLCAPFERAGRLLCPLESDFERAALALSRLRERGRSPSGAKGALLDALIASLASRDGMLLVTANSSDFEKLARELPLHLEPFDRFRRRLGVAQLDRGLYRPSPSARRISPRVIGPFMNDIAQRGITSVVALVWRLQRFIRFLLGHLVPLSTRQARWAEGRVRQMDVGRLPRLRLDSMMQCDIAICERPDQR